MALRRNFYDWRYDDEVPSFVTTGTQFVLYRRNMHMIDIDDLTALCASQGYNLAAPEIGEAPQWWLDANTFPAGYFGAPGYGGGTDPEAPLAPYNLEPPFVGHGNEGGTLTCQSGSWYGVPAPALTYQWFDGSGPIVGATGVILAGPTVDGETYYCEETATNSEGSATVSSNSVTTTEGPKLPWDTGPIPHRPTSGMWTLEEV